MSWQRKYDFKAGTRISSDQVDEEFNQLIAAVNQVQADDVSKDTDVRRIAQMYKMVQDNGLTLVRQDGTNINTLTETGEYFVTGTAQNSPVTNWCFVKVMKYSNSRIVQKLYADTTGEEFTRVYADDWKPWKPVLASQLSGVINFPNQSQISLERSLTIGMPSSGVDYKVFIDVENRDPQNEYSGNLFTPKESGNYLISCYATFNAVVANNTYFRIYKGGSYHKVVGAMTNQQILSSTRILYLTAGQIYEFYLQQNSGSSQLVTSFYLDIVKLT